MSLLNDKARCETCHFACNCRERAFLEALALAQETMESWAKSHILHEWHCRVEDLIGSKYPNNKLIEIKESEKP